MSRVQLALNVADLDEAVVFYTKLFGREPAKVRPGYANFAIDEPPLKLVLIENAGVPGSLNHLGVEVGTSEDVTAAAARLRAEGLVTTEEGDVSCCYARQDKVWVDGPGGEPWEFYTVLADEAAADADRDAGDDAGSRARCCMPRSDVHATAR